jgi:hypothetical protein
VFDPGLSSCDTVEQPVINQAAAKTANIDFMGLLRKWREPAGGSTDFI